MYICRKTFKSNNTEKAACYVGGLMVVVGAVTKTKIIIKHNGQNKNCCVFCLQKENELYQTKMNK